VICDLFNLLKPSKFAKELDDGKYAYFCTRAPRKARPPK
jgi:hypothetical protein